VNKVVARYANGQLVKGTALDFSIDKESFHITSPERGEEWERTEVRIGELKALFYVRDYDGDPLHVVTNEFGVSPPPWERVVEVTFKDGEFLRGTTPRYQPVSPGFFVVPADARSNNLFCYVVEAATEDVHFS
jgi:hypothetical protein